MNTGNDYSPNKEVNNNKSEKYEYLKILDTSKLQALLQQESLLSDDDNFDIDLIQHIMAILDEREPINDITEKSDVNTSLQEFKEKIISELEKEKDIIKVSSFAPILVKTKRKGIRRRCAAIVIAAIVVMILGNTLVASATGFNLWEYVINWGKETFQIGSGFQVRPTTTSSGQSEASNVKSGKFQTINDAIDTLNVNIAAPSWIPSSYEFQSASISNSSLLKALTAIYKADDNVIIFSATVYSTEEAAYSYEIDEASGESMSIDGNTCYIMTNVDQNRIVWIKGNVVYSINGNATKDDLVKMVHSIYEGDKS